MDDEYQAFTSMANDANSILFVSDGEFIINLKSTKFKDDELKIFDSRNRTMRPVNEWVSTSVNILDFPSYGTSTPEGKYYFSVDNKNWTDICYYFNTKFDENGFAFNQNKDVIIRSELNEDINEHLVYFRGDGNADFRWKFDITLLENEGRIGCYGKLENLLDYKKVANGDDIKISKAGLLGTFFSTPIINAPDIVSTQIED